MAYPRSHYRRWALSALLVAFSTTLVGCDVEVSPKRALSNCIAKKVKTMQKSMRGDISEFSHDLHHRIAEQDCREMFTACDADPQGRACARLTSRFAKTPKKLPKQR